VVDDIGEEDKKGKFEAEGGENQAGAAGKKDSKRTLYVKKTQIDPTAVLSYSLGVSVVHFALIITITQVEGVDLSQVGNMSYACQREAAALNSLIKRFMIAHILTLLACLAREIWSSKTSGEGQLMRIVEIFCIPIYMACIFNAMEWLEVIMVREAEYMYEEILKDYDYVTRIPEHYTDGMLSKGY